MSEIPDNTITAALTFKVPQKVGWSVQSADQSWTGSELLDLIDCLARETNSRTITLSLSLIFELTGNGGTVRSLSGMPPGGRLMTKFTPWIQTFTGKRLDLDPPNPDQIDIEDIAHGLSRLCRFNGQCTKFYSVAEHSVHVSHEIDPTLALVGLLHDAAEAYLGDVPSPLKKQLSQFSKFEHQMEKAIGDKFEIDAELFGGEELKRADVQLLIDEKAVFMVEAPEPWPPGAPDVKDTGRIRCWGPEEAKVKFMARYGELTVDV